MAEQSQRQASQQPAEEQSRLRQAGPRSREPRQDLQQPMDPLQRLQGLADNSPQAAQLRRLRELANNSPQAGQMRGLQELANNSPQARELRQLQALARGEERSAVAEPTTNATAKPEATTGKPEPATAKPNLTGLPDQLKNNIEALSGLSMDAVRVHYNSTKPAQLNALAYAQGSDIHLGPGQERHLPHEAWHVVQQAQGRVRPTMQMAGGMAVNDDAGLEREADMMGGRAIAIHSAEVDTARKYKGMPKETTRWQIPQKATYLPDATMGVQQFALSKANLNVAGEDHVKSEKQRETEKEFCESEASGPYYLEQDFTVDGGIPADNPLYQIRFVVAAVIAVRNKPEAMFEQAIELFSTIEHYSNINNEQLKTLVGEIKELDLYTMLRSIGREQLEAYLNGKPAERNKISKSIGNPADQLEKVAKKNNIKSYETESEERSYSMHSAANSHFTKKGVWKIGDAHVGHIKSKYQAKDIKYNLIDEATFQKEFKNWIPPAPEESEWQNKTTQVGSESEETMVPTNPLYSSSADKKSQETTKRSQKLMDLLKDE